MTQALIDLTYRATGAGIYGFFREHRFLSNFHLAPVTVLGLTYPSTEHAFIAQKTTHRDLQRHFAHGIPSCMEARSFG